MPFNRDAIAIAWKHHRAGDDRRAEHLCRQLLAAQPDEPELHFLFGTIAHTLGRSEEAAASFRRAIELKPDYPEAHNNLGNALAALSQFGEAEACYRRALALKVAYPEAHNNLGNVLRRLKRDEEAAASFQRALELRSNYPQAHSNLGNTLRELGRLDEAAASFRRALALKTEYPEAHNNLGIVYAAEGKRAEAIAEFQEAVHQRPKYSDALGNLGTVRDLAFRDPQTGATTVANHRVYDSFGNLTSETNAAVDCLFGFTGRPLDATKGLQNNLNRWYDAGIGRWTSEDPIGFIGCDTNLNRYVGNSPTNKTDPTGMFPPNRSVGGPPPCPVPGGVPGNDWVWHPDPRNSRGGTRRPRLPIPGQSQPSASWDPEGHWDVDNGLGERQRYDQNGKPITAEEAHRPKPVVPPEAVKTVVVVGAGVGVGYFIYRGARMIPSLFPPLWPTIPANLAFP